MCPLKLNALGTRLLDLISCPIYYLFRFLRFLILPYFLLLSHGYLFILPLARFPT
jgi:hypothetical protein